MRRWSKVPSCDEEDSYFVLPPPRKEKANFHFDAERSAFALSSFGKDPRADVFQHQPQNHQARVAACEAHDTTTDVTKLTPATSDPKHVAGIAPPLKDSTKQDALSRTSPISPKGVEEFEDIDEFGSAFFEDHFSSANNPFRTAPEDDRSCSQAPQRFVTQDTTPKKGNAIMTAGSQRLYNQHYPHQEDFSDDVDGSLDDILDSSLPDSSILDETATRLFQDADPPLMANLDEEPLNASMYGSLPSTLPATAARFTPNDSFTTTRTERTIGVNTRIGPKMRMYMDDYNVSFFRGLVYKLMAQSAIIKLDIRRSEPFCRTTMDMELLFQMIQSLPNLKTLCLSNFRTDKDLYYYHQYVFAHPSMEVVSLKTSGIIDAVTMRTLNSISKLTDVRLETTESFDVSLLLRSNSLRRLHISSNGSYSFHNSHVMALVDVLETNRVLMDLDLEPQMSLLAFKFLIQSLRINRSIQVLQVATELNPSRAMVQQVLSECATVLTINNTLRVFNNINHANLQADMACRRWILRALETNVSVQHFQLFREDSSFSKFKRELLRPQDRSCLNMSFADGSTYSSNINSTSRSFLRSEASTQNSEYTNDTFKTAKVFCSSFDDIDVEPMWAASKKFLQHAREQGERTLSFLTLGFGLTKNNKKP